MISSFERSNLALKIEVKLEIFLEDLKRNIQLVGVLREGECRWQKGVVLDMIECELWFSSLPSIMQKYNIDYLKLKKLYDECKELYDEIYKVIWSSEYRACMKEYWRAQNEAIRASIKEGK